MKKIAVGLSGGVDSSVAALLLKREGYDVTGVHMRCWDYDAPGCKGNEDRADAVKIASLLDIPFMDLNFEKEYKERVLSYFFGEIKAGRTPNPDVVCNQEIKFGLFLDWALAHGFDCVATGHYARVAKVNPKALPKRVCYQLLSGIDQSKDQSYFLYRLTQKELKYILSPIGEFRKPEVRKLAKENGLPTHDKPDSTGICFIGDVNVSDFIKSYIKVKPGKVLDLSDEVIGEHEGSELYTIGQRHGFKLSKYFGMPLYVVVKDTKANTITVGFGKDVQKKEFYVSQVSWIDPDGISTARPRPGPLNCLIRIRNLGEKMPGTIEILSSRQAGLQNDVVKVTLDDYAIGVAPGQSAVFYGGDKVLGGGIIS